jgi:sugar/nucleoside kinase (ribokinase family)
MLGDASNITPFGFEDLDSDDLATITKARYVCVFDWLYNKKGTELAEKVFGYCRTNSRARTFFDASDPRPRVKDLSDLNRKVLRNELIDIWGVNENEALIFARLYDRKLKRRPNNAALAAGKVISTNTGAKIYLHTADYSASIRGDQITLVPAFAIVPRRGTGAGDSWNAGIMVADALGLTEEEGLLFGNAVAGRYATYTKRVYSTLPDIMDFLRDPALKLKRFKKASETLETID